MKIKIYSDWLGVIKSKKDLKCIDEIDTTEEILKEADKLLDLILLLNKIKDNYTGNEHEEIDIDEYHRYLKLLENEDYEELSNYEII